MEIRISHGIVSGFRRIMCVLKHKAWHTENVQIVYYSDDANSFLILNVQNNCSISLVTVLGVTFPSVADSWASCSAVNSQGFCKTHG